MAEDLERSGVAAAAKSGQQYGAIDTLKASDGSDEKLPLFLGRWDVAPSKLFNITVVTCIAWFAIHRLADIAYILTVDARFPPGLGHHYPSEEERLASVSYTRQVLICGFLHRICVFSAVLALLLLGLFARFDVALREFVFETVPARWEISYARTMWLAICRCCSACWSPFASCLQTIFGPCLSSCSSLKERALNGRLACDLCDRFGSPLSCRELLFGGLYLTLIGLAFFVISAPFVYWSMMIDLNFGFSNALTVSASGLRESIISGFWSALIFGVPSKFIYLAVLQYRRGWLFMYGLLMLLLVTAQYNIEVIAPHILDMNNAFPNKDFAVGRGFPFVGTGKEKTPWVSLNRIYFKDPSWGGPAHFSTRDKSDGQLTLQETSGGSWSISRALSPHTSVYATSLSAVANHVLDGLKSSSWSVGGDAQIGVRSGSHLRDALYGFARDRHIGIAQIYMVDGSHKDIRANAFVAGAGNRSVIGLFDTLFLGKRNSDGDDGSSLLKVITGDSAILRASEIVQGVDVEEERRDLEAPRNSAPTQAMNDDEIVSILAHELAHAHLKHLEQGMVMQAFTSLAGFAILGWMAHSPLGAMALGLHAPLLHVGACAYEHVVGPPTEGFLKLFSNWQTLRNEYQADAYAARISDKYADALQSSLAKLSVNANQDPDVPLYYELLHSDHPAYARRWAHIEATKNENAQHSR